MLVVRQQRSRRLLLRVIGGVVRRPRLAEAAPLFNGRDGLAQPVGVGL